MALRRGLRSVRVRRVVLAVIGVPLVAACAASSAGAVAPTWTAQKLPRIGTDTRLLGVSCPAKDRCEAVGTTGTGTSQEMVAESWDGSTWRRQNVPGEGSRVGRGSLQGVSCPTTTACVAIGVDESSEDASVFSEELAGGVWHRHPLASPPGAEGSTLTGVSCASVTSCVLVGYSLYPKGTRHLAEQWDGAAWSLLPAVPMAHAVPDAVSCPAPGVCTVVGATLLSSSTTNPAARLQAGRWTSERIPVVQGLDRLLGVSCPTVRLCVAVGVDAKRDGGALVGVWRGRSWTLATIPSVDGTLDGVSCPSASTCRAVGQDTDGSGGPLIEAWNGTTWTRETTQSEPDGSLEAVSCSPAVHCTGAGSDLVAPSYPALAERN